MLTGLNKNKPTRVSSEKDTCRVFPHKIFQDAMRNVRVLIKIILNKEKTSSTTKN